MSGVSTYSHTFHVPVDPEVAFTLFADPAWLDPLTPRWFRLRPVHALPPRLAVGTEISYRLRWHGLPLAWTSRITDWRPLEFFAYEQQRGPYLFFRHEHEFLPADGGTEIRDRVFFRSLGGRLVDRLLVRPELRRIFCFRQRRAPEVLRALQAGTGTGFEPRRRPRTSASSSPIERPT